MFLLFAGHCYYPQGGTEDFRGFYPSIDEARQAFIDKKDEIKGSSYLDNWGEIVEHKTMRSVLYTRVDSTQGHTVEQAKWSSCEEK